MTMISKTQPGRAGASPSRGCLRPLMGALLLLLGWASAAPARATSVTISTAVAGPIIVGAGETLTIIDGGSVTTTNALTVGVAVQAGGTLNIEGGSVTAGPGGLGIFLGDYLGGATLNMTGGSVHGDNSALQIDSGSTATISGGSLSGGNYGVVIAGGTMTLSGGSVSGSTSVTINSGGTATISGGMVSGGIDARGGTATLSGCDLAITNGVLTGTLMGGTPIDVGVAGTITLDSATTQIACPANQTAVATSAAGAVVTFPAPVVSNTCGGPVTVTCVPASGSTFPIGSTTVACTVTDAFGNSHSCGFTVTVTAPDLAVAITADPSPIPTGSSLTYTITVQNLGPPPALGVTLTDLLPAGTSFDSASPSTGTVTPPRGNGSTVSWSVGSLAASDSATLTLVVKVRAKAGDTITNSASVTNSSGADSNPGNNSASVSTPVASRH